MILKIWEVMMRKLRTILVVLLCLGITSVSFSQDDDTVETTPEETVSVDRAEEVDSDQEELAFYSLEEMLNVKVVSASKSAEKLYEAPARMIVISRKDIATRGYTSIMDAFDDLPGVDLVRGYGDTYYKMYWRGWKSGVLGIPFIVMIDGVVYNHLYYNNDDNFYPVPLSNVEKIEVVFGPASSLYGPNAAMGVINVITINDKKKNGSSLMARVGYENHDFYTIDGNYFYKNDDFRVSLTTRIEDGNIDDLIPNNNFEYTKDTYYANTTYWGGVLANTAIAGSFSSQMKSRAFDLRVFMKGIEFAAQYSVHKTGYGVVYTADTTQNNGVWTREHYDFYVRYSGEITKKISSTTMIRYRRDDIPNDAFYVYSYDNASVQTVGSQTWQALNDSWSFQQDFRIAILKSLTLVTGVAYEAKDLQKAYDVSYGTEYAAATIDLSTNTNFYASSITEAQQHNNRVLWIDKSLFAQAKWNFLGDQHLILGGRLDHNSVYGLAPTFRGGYVGRFGSFIGKVLYGEAYREPSPRELYGSWSGLGSNPNLDPEKSRTVEVVASYTMDVLENLVDVWYANNRDVIIATSSGARNLGNMTVVGIDYQLKGIIPVTDNFRIMPWAYYTFVVYDDETKYDSSGNKTGSGEIGDIADHKIWFGLTTIWKDLSVTAKGRYIGKRKTVDTNPVDVDAYITLDASIRYNNLFVEGLALSVKGTNLLNTDYFHPGFGDANSGDSAGENQGYYYNSMMPQPERSIMVSIDLAI
ncbi:MAG: TonB-dependent receptor [bacterium]|nr:TonB-dependent receptor [bacterium]